MHGDGGAASCMGIPDALGEQTDWRARSCGARPGTDESAERPRLADLARLSVARATFFQVKDANAYARVDRKRSALPITETELKLIAAPAIIGLRSRPKNGYS